MIPDSTRSRSINGRVTHHLRRGLCLVPATAVVIVVAVVIVHARLLLHGLLARHNIEHSRELVDEVEQPLPVNVSHTITTVSAPRGRL
jgi:hypothetical protein